MIINFCSTYQVFEIKPIVPTVPGTIIWNTFDKSLI
jgi:hypothetical protein